MNYLQVVMMKSRRNLKYKLLFLFILIFTMINLFSTLNEANSFLLEEISADRQMVNSILTEYRKMDTHSTEAEADPLYLNLVNQSELLARREQTILFENWSLYQKTSIALTALQLEAAQMPESAAYRKYLPIKNQVLLDRAFFQEIAENNRPIYTENQVVILAVLVLLGWMGLIWYPLVSLMSSDLLLEESDHLSENRGYPLLFRKRLATRAAYQIAVFFLVFVLMLLVALCFGVNYALGDLTYPIPVFLTEYTTVPFSGYLLLLLFYFLVITFFGSLLALWLNVLTNNLYLSLFSLIGLYLIPVFFEEFTGKLWFFPMIYLNPVSVLEAKYLQGNFVGGYFCGLIVLLFWSSLILFGLGRTRFIHKKARN